MTANSNDLSARALALFERALDRPQGTRTAWIKERAGDDAVLRDKALSYLSRDKMTQSAFHTGGAFHETLDDTAVPEQIGAYKITGLIGRGGKGRCIEANGIAKTLTTTLSSRSCAPERCQIN